MTGGSLSPQVQNMDPRAMSYSRVVPAGLGGARAPHSGLVVLACAWAAVLFFPSIGFSDETGNAEADSLCRRIETLRCEGRYGAAVELAQDLVRIRTEGTERPWQREDAERLVTTLEYVSGLAFDRQQTLARADCLDSDVHRFVAKREYEDCEDLVRRQLDIRRRLLGPDHPEVAASLNVLGVVLRETGEYGEAETVLRRALDLRRRVFGPRHPDVAESLNDLGTVLWKQGDVAGAEPLIRKALAMRRDLLGPEDDKVAKSLNNLAILYYSRGDFARAAPLYREALAVHRRTLGADNPETAALMNNLAILLSRQGNYAEAEDLFLEVLETRRRLLGPEHLEIARSLGTLAHTHSGMEEYEAAEDLLREALALRKKLLGDEHLEISMNLINLASVLKAEEKYGEAEPLCSDGLAMAQRALGETHPLVIQGRCLHSLILMGVERREDAEIQLRETLELCRTRFGNRHPQTGEALRELGVCLLEQGRPDEARAFLEQAATVFDDARLRAGGGFERATFQTSPYRHLAEACLELKRDTDAWPAAERSLGRALADLLMVSEQPAASEVFTLERIQRSMDPETALIGWLWVEMTGVEPDAWGYVIRDSGPVRWVHLAVSGPEDASTDGGAGDFQEALALAGSWPFRVVSTERICADARRLWSQWVAPMELHLEGARNVVVIPSGPMLGIPIEALVDGDGTYLGERYAVSYAPSATIRTWLQEQAAGRGRPSSRSALLVGDPPFAEDHLAAMMREKEWGNPPAGLKWTPVGSFVSASVLRSAAAGDEYALARLPRLPWTRVELERVSAAVPGSVTLLGPDASEQEFVNLARSGTLERFDTIHLATHALVDDERPQHSALVLSRVNLPDAVESTVAGERIFDGLLSAEEIVRECRLDADLVVLSGCQTALGRKATGEGYIGLAQAFLQAGARSLVVSLWRVEDEATALLMGRFYENLTGATRDARDGPSGEMMGKARALQEAKDWLRAYSTEAGERPFLHPAYWSGFVLIGNTQ